jgi:hypothetical protein
MVTPCLSSAGRGFEADTFERSSKKTQTGAGALHALDYIPLLARGNTSRAS